MTGAGLDSTLSTFTASDGDNLALQDWPVADGVALRGLVLVVHGLGEHAGRYDRLAGHLREWGFSVRGYDQFGHGDSDGARGALPTPSRLVDDLADVVDSTRLRIPAGVPLILLGHSLGGLVAGCFVAQGKRPVDALVLSSPALDAGLGRLQKLLLSVMRRLAPDAAVGNGLDPNFLSHDPKVVAGYRADPRVHDRITARLAQFIAESGPQLLSQADAWKVPTLLLYAGADQLVNPAGSRAFSAAAPAGIVASHCFENLYHEIFNEQHAEPVLARLKQWLDARF